MEKARRRIRDDAAIESWGVHLYEPLDPERQQIRVLKLLPSPDLRSDPVGELYTLDLANRANITTIKVPPGQLYDSSMGLGSFAAISYRWDDSGQQTMILDGRVMRIGENAHEALKFLRKADTSIHLWIDTICINQANNSERSQQVALMETIYRLACPVYVWTGGNGPKAKSADRALRLVSRMAEVMLSNKSKEALSQVQQRGAAWSQMRDVTREDWDHLRRFAKLSIWTRVWVQQEIVLSWARLVGVIVAGHFHVNLFTVMCGTPEELSAQPLAKAASATKVVTIVCYSWFARRSIPEHLIMWIVRRWEATNPKDYVYGMSALVPYLVESVDYNKPIAEVYKEAMFAILKRTNSLRQLLQISHHDKTMQDDVPSWVHDWREKEGSRFGYRWGELGIIYNASHGYPVRLECKEYLLGIAFHPLFVIDCLGPSTEFDYEILKPPTAQRDFVFSGLGYNGTPQYGVYQEFDEAFEKALLLDLNIGIKSGLPEQWVSPDWDRQTSGVSIALHIIRGDTTGPRETHPDAAKVFKRLCDRLRNTRIGVSPGQQICILPEKTQVDDLVCIVAGSNVPVVLRKRESFSGENTYQVVGGTYVQGVMDGEAIQKKSGHEDEDHKDAYITQFHDIWLV